MAMAQSIYTHATIAAPSVMPHTQYVHYATPLSSKNISAGMTVSTLGQERCHIMGAQHMSSMPAQKYSRLCLQSHSA